MKPGCPPLSQQVTGNNARHLYKVACHPVTSPSSPPPPARMGGKGGGEGGWGYLRGYSLVGKVEKGIYTDYSKL